MLLYLWLFKFSKWNYPIENLFWLFFSCTLLVIFFLILYCITVHLHWYNQQVLVCHSGLWVYSFASSKVTLHSIRSYQPSYQCSRHSRAWYGRSREEGIHLNFIGVLFCRIYILPFMRVEVQVLQGCLMLIFIYVTWSIQIPFLIIKSTILRRSWKQCSFCYLLTYSFNK